MEPNIPATRLNSSREWDMMVKDPVTRQAAGHTTHTHTDHGPAAAVAEERPELRYERNEIVKLTIKNAGFTRLKTYFLKKSSYTNSVLLFMCCGV